MSQSYILFVVLTFIRLNFEFCVLGIICLPGRMDGPARPNGRGICGLEFVILIPSSQKIVEIFISPFEFVHSWYLGFT